MELSLNKNLVLSLKQDLKLIVGITGEILSEFPEGNINVNSWLFPAKRHDQVSENYLKNLPESCIYCGHLELILDRLYLMLNLVVKFVESSLPQGCNTGLNDFPKNVIRPPNLSLGGLCQHVWKALVGLKSLPSNKTKKQRSSKNSSKNIVDVISLDAPSCNEIASKWIVQIKGELDQHVQESNLQKTMEETKKDLFGLTQSECLENYCNAILADFRSLITQHKISEAIGEERLRKITELEDKLLESHNTVSRLDRTLRTARKSAQHLRQTKECLIRRVNELIRLNKSAQVRFNQERTKNCQLEKSLSDTTASIALLNHDNQALQGMVERIRCENADLVKERECWKNRFGELYMENRRLKSELNRIDPRIEAMLKTVEKIGASCDKTLLLLEKSDAKVLEKSDMYEDFLKKIVWNDGDAKRCQCRRQSKTPPIGCYDSTSFYLSSLNLTGNPIDDMRNQIDTNLCNIKRLEQYNSDLERTISRVQQKISL